ncbi:hypothetical protein TWF694_011492 [Orbilia ellipsospora]|uniref:Uncharacterized protein n=1 Tax=Orbilia ellipsospora TaxID=2528407 RepID=A0AAV9X6M4_9PEZI
MAASRYKNIPTDTESEAESTLYKLSTIGIDDDGTQALSTTSTKKPASPEIKTLGAGLDLSHGQPRRFFILRAILSTLIPLALSAYYIVTYIRWLRYPEDSSQRWLATGYLDNAEVVSYSWFVLGTFALNLGTYALAGSIASMAMTPIWRPKNARRLLNLAANSFADPSSWLKIPAILMRGRAADNGRLWNFLTMINILGFLVWPLTGLTMQTSDGFAFDAQGKSRGGPVLGHNTTTFSVRDPSFLIFDTLVRLQTGNEPELPWGQMYSSVESSTRFNVTTRNMLPEDATEPVFLTLQAENPFNLGQAFGILISYNCSIVTSLSQFTILNLRRDTPDDGTSDDIYAVPVDQSDRNDVGSSILVLQRWEDVSGLVSNTYAVMEIGTSIPYKNLTYEGAYQAREYSGYSNGSYLNAGLKNPTILEVALWQSVSSNTTLRNVEYKGVEEEIPELGGVYLGTRRDATNITTPLGRAIGCRCFAASELGFADVDGTTATYSNFNLIQDINFGRRSRNSVHRFERGILQLLVGNANPYYSFFATFGRSLSGIFDSGWYLSLWRATGLIWKNTQAVDLVRFATSPIQANDLKSILIRYHKAYALELMYDGLSNTDGGRYWNNTDIHLATKAMILLPGVVPPIVIVIALGVWSVSIAMLTVIYQFRRRWAEKLDTFNMFKLGVSRPGGVEPEDLHGKAADKALEKVPIPLGS